MNDLTPAEHLLYSTFRIESYKDNVLLSTGTGFLFNFPYRDNEPSYPEIITNKHVLEGADTLVVRSHVSEDDSPTGETVNLIIDNLEHFVFEHPSTQVDLCGILVGALYNQAAETGKPLFFKAIHPGFIPAEDEWSGFDAIEEITMVGCPNGIYDSVNNLPIARRGHTATSLTKSYNGKNEFMIDMACFPGSSGSPIFIHDRFGYWDRKTNSYEIGKTRLRLVGILYAGPQVTNSGHISLATPPSVHVNSMMHLGNAIKSSELTVLNQTLSDNLDQGNLK